MPPAGRLLRLLSFAVPAALAVSALQPLLAVTAGHEELGWALSLAAPCLAVAGFLLVAARLADPGSRRPPSYSAWLLFPGAFLLAGAASMCIFGALVRVPGLQRTCWGLLGLGAVSWTAALVWIRLAGKPQP